MLIRVQEEMKLRIGGSIKEHLQGKSNLSLGMLIRLWGEMRLGIKKKN